MSLFGRTNRAAKAGVIAWAGGSGLLEPLSWFGVLPTPQPWMRIVFFGSVVLAAVVVFARGEDVEARPQPVAQAQPSVEVIVRPALIQHPSIGIRDILSIDVRNLSAQSVFITEVTLALVGEMKLITAQDAVTGEWLQRRELRPGDSFCWNVSPQRLFADGRTPSNFVRAVAKDAVGRTYESDPAELQGALKSILKPRRR